MTTNMSFINLILNASIVVQLVMLSLLLASVGSWSIIFSKQKLIKKIKIASDKFLITSVSFSPDGSKIASDKFLIRSVSFSPDGSKIISESVDGIGKIWDSKTYTLINQLEVQCGFGETLVKFSPNR